MIFDKFKHLFPFPLHLVILNMVYHFLGKQLETMWTTKMKTVKLDLHKKFP
jgi:hypothetical protein